MTKPGENDEILLVAILRFLKKTQDEVVEILQIAKKRVVAIEEWIRNAPLEEVEALFLDYRLKKVVEDILAEVSDVERRDLVLAARITADDVLTHYRGDYFQKQPTEGLPGDKAKADPETSRLCQAHQTGMLNLVKRLSNELDPHLCQFPLRELNRGSRRWRRLQSERLESKTTSDYSLFWKVTSQGDVYLCYPMEVDQDPQTRIVHGYLEKHLKSSQYYWLVEDKEKGISKWRRLGGEELIARTKLLNAIERAVMKLTDKPLSHPDVITCIGPTTWFSLSIWGLVLDGLNSNLNYKVEPAPEGPFVNARIKSTHP